MAFGVSILDSMKTSPTQRSLALLRERGYLCAIVEKWNPYVRIRQDLWGFADILAIKGDESLLVQTTSGSNVSARLAKIENNVQAAMWKCSPNRKIVVHGWAKRGARGERKLWTCREVEA